MSTDADKQCDAIWLAVQSGEQREPHRRRGHGRRRSSAEHDRLTGRGAPSPNAAMPADGADNDAMQHATDDAAATHTDGDQHSDGEHSPESDLGGEDGRRQQVRCCMALPRARMPVLAQQTPTVRQGHGASLEERMSWPHDVPWVP